MYSETKSFRLVSTKTAVSICEITSKQGYINNIANSRIQISAQNTAIDLTIIRKEQTNVRKLWTAQIQNKC